MVVQGLNGSTHQSQLERVFSFWKPHHDNTANRTVEMDSDLRLSIAVEYIAHTIRLCQGRLEWQ
jgi:hypothetical protein